MNGDLVLTMLANASGIVFGFVATTSLLTLVSLWVYVFIQMVRSDRQLKRLLEDQKRRRLEDLQIRNTEHKYD